MLTIVVSVALLACSASAFNVTNINNQTDTQAPAVNRFLTEGGLGLFMFPAMGDERIRLGPGVQIGLNTIQRTGDCFITDFDNGTVYLNFSLGFKLFLLGYGQMNMGGEDMAGLFKVNKNAGRLSYWVHNATSCHVELDRYEITLLDDATLFSSQPKFEGMDVSSLFREYGKAKINNNMLGQRDAVQNRLQTDICSAHTLGALANIHNSLRANL